MSFNKKKDEVNQVIDKFQKKLKGYKDITPEFVDEAIDAFDKALEFGQSKANKFLAWVGGSAIGLITIGAIYEIIIALITK